MDPVTQGFLGAATAQAVLAPRRTGLAALAGAVGGMTADLDILLRPFGDPAFPLEFHRHFTHSLAFAPIGGVLSGMLLLLLPAARPHKRLVLTAATIGYLTHAPLDLLTAYGTMLLWPFSSRYEALDVISVIDPIVTLTLTLAVFLTWRFRRRTVAAAGLMVVLVYFTFAAQQHGRAADVQRQLAEARGHARARWRVMPTLGNALVWRAIYEDAEGRFHADLIRVLPSSATVWPGGTAIRFFAADLSAEGIRDEAAVSSFRRFERFADGYTARLPDRADVIGDMRYAYSAGFDAIWGVRLDPADARAPVRWISLNEHRTRILGRLWKAITNDLPGGLQLDGGS